MDGLKITRETDGLTGKRCYVAYWRNIFVGQWNTLPMAEKLAPREAKKIKEAGKPAGQYFVGSLITGR